MRTLLLKSLLAAVLIGPAIGFVSYVASVHGATKYDPPLSEAEINQMKGLSINEVEAAFRGRKIKLTRWEWLLDSIHYFYFWKQVADSSIVPSSGVFIACFWMSWTERQRVQRICS